MWGREIKTGTRGREREWKTERERLSKRYHHRVNSCGFPLVLLHPGLQRWRSWSPSSAGTTFIQSKSRVSMGSRCPCRTWTSMFFPSLLPCEFLSRCITQICFARPGIIILLLLLSALTRIPLWWLLLWNFPLWQSSETFNCIL